MRDELIQKYEATQPLLEELAAALKRETEAALSGVPHIDRIYFRVKAADRFVAKALDPDTEPPYSDPLVEIEDQVAGRILVFFLPDVEVVKEGLQGTFTTVESRHRRPEKDEEFGYESHHLICLIPPQTKPNGWATRQDVPTTFELQLSTLFMHAWAEPQHDLAYKGAMDLPREIRRELSWIAASAWGADQAFERVWSWQLEEKASHGDDT